MEKLELEDLFGQHSNGRPKEPLEEFFIHNPADYYSKGYLESLNL